VATIQHCSVIITTLLVCDLAWPKSSIFQHAKWREHMYARLEILLCDTWHRHNMLSYLSCTASR